MEREFSIDPNLSTDGAVHQAITSEVPLHEKHLGDGLFLGNKQPPYHSSTL
jgi:hypothetical protein